MANELSWRHTATGETLYGTIRSAARTYWNTSGTPALETLTVANWANYAIAIAESPASSYFFVGTWPAGLTTAGWYWVDVYKRVGGAAAISDTFLGTLVVYWDGTAAKPWAGDATQLGGTAQTGRDIGASVLLAAGSIVTGTFGACVPPAPSDMATESSLTIALNRIGAFAGTGVNTILGFFRALMRKDTGITTPSDVGGTYDHAADSNQVIAESFLNTNMLITNVDSNVGSSANAILAYVDCLPAAWITVPTAAENADAVLDEAKGTHTGLLAGLTFTTPNRVDASATATVDGQSVADAMKLTPSAGTAAAGSVQAKLDAVAKPGDAMDLLDTIMRST